MRMAGGQEERVQPAKFTGVGKEPFLRGIVGGAKVVSKRPVCTWEASGGAPRLSSRRGRPPVASRTADSGRSVSDIFFRPPQTFKT